MNDKTEGFDVHPSEAQVPWDGPALFINRFYVTLGAIVRIAFAEQPALGHKPFFRNAVSLSLGDAVVLRDLLTDVIGRAQVQISEQSINESQQKLKIN